MASTVHQANRGSLLSQHLDLLEQVVTEKAARL